MVAATLIDQMFGSILIQRSFLTCRRHVSSKHRCDPPEKDQNIMRLFNVSQVLNVQTLLY